MPVQSLITIPVIVSDRVAKISVCSRDTQVIICDVRSPLHRWSISNTVLAPDDTVISQENSAVNTPPFNFSVISSFADGSIVSSLSIQFVELLNNSVIKCDDGESPGERRQAVIKLKRKGL